MIKLVEVHDEQRGLLWNIFQKYLYEMTAYYADEMDGEGNYRYEYFDAYFTERGRKALLIFEEHEPSGERGEVYDDEVLSGFAMINKHSYIEENPDYVLAEFTVFPMYRRRHIATEAARQIFKEYSKYGGKWEVKYSEKNTAAKSLWSKATSEYRPKAWMLGDDEVVLSFRTMG